jgi:alpha-D-ribose 1-methylphosphonate 5-phosphate C-P lyase
MTFRSCAEGLVAAKAHGWRNDKHRQQWQNTLATYAYPVKVDDRYVMDPSPIPKFDNPKLNDCAALQLFGAGREKRIYAIPPYTQVVSLDFEDHPFEPYRHDAHCELCGAGDSYLDEVITDDQGTRMFVCSDSDYCETRRTVGHTAPLSGAATKASS